VIRATFDLRRANHQLLRRAGVRRDSIDVCEICTRCSGDEWFSHRGQGPLTGRFGAVIAIVDEP
jgi:copper oxidase (laccase) domain-containing protein